MLKNLANQKRLIAKSDNTPPFEHLNVRVSADEMKEPWFVAKDVAEVLGYIDTAQAIRKHCKGVVVSTTPSAGGLQKTKIINQHDLIRLCMKSKLPFTENHLPEM